jgi:uncharacterized protein (TIGR02300 family)
VTKPELGTKRSCAQCGAKFYDLHQSPITCPKCGAVPKAVQVSSRPRVEAVRALVRERKPVVEESLEARSRSPKDADPDAEREKNPGEASGRKDDVDDAGLGDAAFIDEREDIDLTDIISDDKENDKDT